MSVCFLLLGTNMGDKVTNLRLASDHISSQIGPVITSSSVYTTSAWGKEDQDDFLNQVLKVYTDKTPAQLLQCCLSIERDLGRVRFEKWGQRLIDIDVLYYDDLILDDEDLKIPHPEIQNRRFTLVPLVEIAADWVHPEIGKSQRELLDVCGDSLEVKVC
ncbi:2-amino-4-hydroxy-6-hydroxymethyldihydropteridine diphosphokinase [Reichenbachiella agarivorans]|uniref:2-amino-4-hydroxy-6-hydroxymethyldihydropteridine pyrophosphokinase n=1 Tax=Reichenbachiella agarivorans TaxID=2979464 RepID=A0ABY6CKL0_9BACT|nr:2-amino-4-hydroxy-6-hydroxymethyldihydropteridine diphosphokinase [Reichenbachiella agarivorans]UXP31059.1 2-amino-4-hydroxy-6-hydroxymethyldihydropteridine diphosphokinase [Reichenbachiella agarivorans]